MTKKQGFPQVFLFINGFCRRPSLPEFGGWFNLLDGYLDHRTGGFLWAFRKRWDMVGLPYQMRKEWRLQDACCCFLFHHDSFSLVGHSLIHCILICPDMPLPNVSQDDSQQRDRFWWNLALWNFVDIKITARDQTTLYRGTRAFSRPWQIDYVLRRGETEKDAILCRKSLPIVWLELFLDLNYQIWFVRFWFAETKTSGEKNKNNSNKILETPKRLPANSKKHTCATTHPMKICGNHFHLLEFSEQKNWSQIWSLGCCVLEMATGCAPWADRRFDNILQARNGDFSLICWYFVVDKWWLRWLSWLFTMPLFGAWCRSLWKLMIRFCLYL